MVNLRPKLALLESQAAQLSRVIESLCPDTEKKVVLVGHSLGGLVCRYYLEWLARKGRPADLITLGTPHYGTYQARLAPGACGGQLLPGSPFLTELNQANKKPKGKITCIWSRFDSVVIPVESGRMEGCAELALDYTGHNALLFSGRVGRAIHLALLGKGL